MSSPITNVPQGLLSLLGLRDFGSVPRFCDLSIAPGIDVTQFLLLNREEVQSPALGMSSLNSVSNPAVTVPAGELWYIHSQTITSAALAAAETIGLQPGFIWGNIFQANGDTVRATAGNRASVAAWNSFWAPAGTQLALRTNEITTAGSINCFIGLNFTRLRV